jgi:hypothetical protein
MKTVLFQTLSIGHPDWVYEWSGQSILAATQCPIRQRVCLPRLAACPMARKICALRFFGAAIRAAAPAGSR